MKKNLTEYLYLDAATSQLFSGWKHTLHCYSFKAGSLYACRHPHGNGILFWPFLVTLLSLSMPTPLPTPRKGLWLPETFQLLAKSRKYGVSSQWNRRSVRCPIQGEIEKCGSFRTAGQFIHGEPGSLITAVIKDNNAGSIREQLSVRSLGIPWMSLM